MSATGAPDPHTRRREGYCKLCRAKEIELYNMRLADTPAEHERACREAGCKHPIAYVLKPGTTTWEPVTLLS